MAKGKKPIKESSIGMPKAPWIYVADPTRDSVHAKELAALIPDVLQVALGHSLIKSVEIPNKPKSIVLITDLKNDFDNTQKIEHANIWRAKALKAGANFVSVNIMFDSSKTLPCDVFPKNHLSLEDRVGLGQKIYKWLFTALTIRETLHLIPEEQMRKTDNKQFPTYKYCPISESRTQPKDAKIQFVALVLTKPQVIDGKKVTWSVADRSGVANFYFQYRGDTSKYTWDWVMSLKPGDRKTLPRMPCVEVIEKKRVRLAKLPLRIVGVSVQLVGGIMINTGRGIAEVGVAMRMGKSKEWVPEADVGSDGKEIDREKVDDEGVVTAKKDEGEKKVVDVFDEKGAKKWDDGASVASTDVGSDGSDLDEKKDKEFV